MDNGLSVLENLSNCSGLTSHLWVRLLTSVQGRDTLIVIFVTPERWWKILTRSGDKL